TTRVQLEAMEHKMALRQARHLQQLPSESATSLTSSSGIGLITLDTKPTGKPSAGKQQGSGVMSVERRGPAVCYRGLTLPLVGLFPLNTSAFSLDIWVEDLHLLAV